VESGTGNDIFATSGAAAHLRKQGMQTDDYFLIFMFRELRKSCYSYWFVCSSGGVLDEETFFGVLFLFVRSGPCFDQRFDQQFARRGRPQTGRRLQQQHSGLP
jgi:hypothetical protein